MPLPFRRLFSRPPSVVPYSFQRHLQDGEQILWQGRPDFSSFVGRKILRDTLLVLPILPVAMGIASLRYSRITFGSTPSWIIGLISITLIVAYMMQENRLQGQWTQYAVSSKRVFFRYLVMLPTQERQVKVEEFTLERLKPHLCKHGRGYGTITFGLPRWRYDLAFHDILDSDAVFQMLMQTQASLPQREEAPYYVKHPQTDIFSQPFVVEEHLRRGEQILWRGQPDVKAYIRSVHPQ